MSSPRGPEHAQPYRPLVSLFGDAAMAAIFSERAAIEAWLEVERALAAAQASVGLIPGMGRGTYDPLMSAALHGSHLSARIPQTRWAR